LLEKHTRQTKFITSNNHQTKNEVVAPNFTLSPKMAAGKVLNTKKVSAIYENNDYENCTNLKLLFTDFNEANRIMEYT